MKKILLGFIAIGLISCSDTKKDKYVEQAEKESSAIKAWAEKKTVKEYKDKDVTDSIRVLTKELVSDKKSEIEIKGMEINVFEISERQAKKIILDFNTKHYNYYSKKYKEHIGSSGEKVYKKPYENWYKVYRKSIDDYANASKDKLIYHSIAINIKKDTTINREYFFNDSLKLIDSILLK